MRLRLIWIWVGLAFIPVACGPKGETTSNAAASEPRIVPVRLAPVVNRTVERTISLVGSLKGWEEVTIGAKRTGRVARVLHDLGDRVPPGELLAQLETTDADLAIEQAKRRLDSDLAKIGLKELPKSNFDVTAVPSVLQAKAGWDRAKLNLARERALINKGAGTTQDFQNAENDEKSNVAAYDNAILNAESTLSAAMVSKVALDVALQAKQDLFIRAPQPSQLPDGVKSGLNYAVSRRIISEGQMVKEGEALFDLVIENPLRIWVTVPERYTGEVKIGQEVRIKVDAYPKEVFVGKVKKINPAIDSASRTFQAEAVIPNTDGRLRPGGFAKALIVINRSDKALTVPREAIRQFAGVTKIYAVDDAKHAHEVKVRTGEDGEGWIEVIGDVPPNGQVAVEGLEQLADGTTVTLKEPVADQTPVDARHSTPKPKD